MVTGMTIIRKQKAAREYECAICGYEIVRGSVYLRHTDPPPFGQRGWLVQRECSRCATMFGRAGLVE